MTRSAVHTDPAPAAIGPYSQAVHFGHLLFVSGTLPVDPRTGQLVGGDIEAQSRQVFRNLAAIAEAAGGQLADVVPAPAFRDRRATEFQHQPGLGCCGRGERGKLGDGSAGHKSFSE